MRLWCVWSWLKFAVELAIDFLRYCGKASSQLGVCQLSWGCVELVCSLMKFVVRRAS
jgi:hypothetical protein